MSTLTLALHRDVIAWIFAPLIPAFSASIELRVLSSSATAEDMLAVYEREIQCVLIELSRWPQIPGTQSLPMMLMISIAQVVTADYRLNLEVEVCFESRMKSTEQNSSVFSIMKSEEFSGSILTPGIKRLHLLIPVMLCAGGTVCWILLKVR